MTDQARAALRETDRAAACTFRRSTEAPALCPKCLRPLSPSAGVVDYPAGLTVTERLFWRVLASNAGNVVPHERFARYIGAAHCGQTIMRLRRKVSPRRIVNCHGVGYMLVPEERAQP